MGSFDYITVSVPIDGMSDDEISSPYVFQTKIECSFSNFVIIDNGLFKDIEISEEEIWQAKYPHHGILSMYGQTDMYASLTYISAYFDRGELQHIEVDHGSSRLLESLLEDNKAKS